MSDFMSGYDGGEDSASVNTQDGFNAALAEKVSGGDPASAAGNEPEAPNDPATDSPMSIGEALVQDLLDPSTDRSLSSGLEVKEPAAPEVGTIHGEDPEVVWETLGTAAEQLEEAQAELGLFRDTEIIEPLEASLAEGEGTAEVLGEAAYSFATGQLSQDAYLELRSEAVDQYAYELYEAGALEPDDDTGEFTAEQLSQVAGLLDAEVRNFALQRHVQETEETIQQLMPAAADQRLQEMRLSLIQLSSDQDIATNAEKLGIRPTELLDLRLRAAEAEHLRTTGQPLADLWADPAVPAHVAHEALAQADARNGATIKLAMDHDFKARLLSSGAGSLSEGLEYLGVPAVTQHLPLPTPEQIAKTDAAFRNRKRVQHPGVRQAVLRARGRPQGWLDRQEREADHSLERDRRV